MAMTTYTYSITNDFLNGILNSNKLTTEIIGSGIATNLLYVNTNGDSCEIVFVDELSSPNITILNGLVATHDGAADVAPIMEVKLTDLPKDISGKLRVHQTSRRLGTRICWAGVGDDQSDPHKVGGGVPISFIHHIGDPDPDPIYVDFNMVNNETWVHEGYVTWKDAILDTITLDLVTRTTGVTVGSNTNYNLYGGYLIVPAAGNGTVSITSDITTHSGGLVYIPNDDLGNPPAAYWNATWNTSTKRYENITAAPTGNGRYNMFAIEINLAKFINKMPLLHSGFIALNSSDSDQIGHGMRLKITSDTNTDTASDHEWALASTICLHRKKSV
jgi:hypothetical protein